jgi:ABC-2 type transport system permease protein
MYKLAASMRKDILLMLRDRVGLVLMFLMPAVLVILITLLQDNTYRLINEKRMPLLLVVGDTARVAQDFVMALNDIGVFEIDRHGKGSDVKNELLQGDRMIALEISAGF